MAFAKKVHIKLPQAQSSAEGGFRALQHNKNFKSIKTKLSDPCGNSNIHRRRA